MLKKFFPLFVLIGVIVPFSVFAQTCSLSEKDCGGVCVPERNICLNLTYPDFGPLRLAESQSIGSIIVYLYYFIVAVAGLASFVMLVWGGAQWLVSGAAPSQAGEARDKIRNAIIGLLLVVSSFLLVQVLNPELTVLRGDLLPDPCDPSTGNDCSVIKLAGKAEYRCQRLGGIDDNYECEGVLPVVPSGSPNGPGEQCVLTQTKDGNSSGCANQCRGSGGESVKLVGGGEEIWHCCNATSAGSCSPGGETFAFVQTTSPESVNQSVMRAEYGVYGCDDDGCLKAWRKFVEDTPDVENSPIQESSPPGDTIEGQIGSLWIHGKDIIVVMFEHENYAGDRICFKGWENKDGSVTYDSPPGRLINRLDDAPFGGWGNETDSLRIFTEKTSEVTALCPSYETRMPPP